MWKTLTPGESNIHGQSRIVPVYAKGFSHFFPVRCAVFFREDGRHCSEVPR